jgi:hypothetical protein
VLCKLSSLKEIKSKLLLLNSFAIFLLLLKPVMLILLNKVRQDRIGTGTSPTFGRWGLGAANGKVDSFVL